MGKKMNKLALGTVQFGLDYGINNKNGQTKPEDVYKILDLARSSGILTLDTAYAYGNSEVVIGKYLEEHSGFSIVSKIPNKENLNIKLVYEESRERLHQDTIYGYLYHNFSIYEENPHTFQELLSLKKEGKVSKIGFSLYYPSELRKILDENLDIDLIQVPYSIFDQRFQKHFSELKARGIEIHVRSVFLQGLVFKKPEDLDPDFLLIKPKLEKLIKIAKDSKVPISALCLNFATLNPLIDKVVIGVDTLENLQENLHDLELNNLVFQWYNDLKELSETNEDIILPINWKK
jgi:aryl-alcohol dehydrogenase-like predicted oxidoreductase